MKPFHDKTLKILDEWMSTFNWEPGHMRQVARLAVRIFDELTDLHGLSDEDRFLLEGAALVHDVGFGMDPFEKGLAKALSNPAASHHKHSRDLILGHDFPGLDNRQKTIIALLARYHRKAPPKRKHKLFGKLGKSDRERVKKLAALLRIADGLDRSHTRVVEDLHCRLEEKHVAFVLKAYRNPGSEMYGARKKSALFEDIFQRKLVLEIRDTPLFPHTGSVPARQRGKSTVRRKKCTK